MNLFVRELIVVVVIAVQCVSYKEVLVPVQEDRGDTCIPIGRTKQSLS